MWRQAGGRDDWPRRQPAAALGRSPAQPQLRQHAGQISRAAAADFEDGGQADRYYGRPSWRSHCQALKRYKLGASRV
eukprot:scaffold12990_cov99-Isochrysis_galbana.AAC.2